MGAIRLSGRAWGRRTWKNAKVVIAKLADRSLILRAGLVAGRWWILCRWSTVK